MAAVTLEQARPFSLHSLSLDNTNTGDISPYYYAGQLEGQDETLPPPVLYLSPASFYATFERTSPSCLNDGAVELIRASVALLFLTVISGVLTIQISISSYRKERQLKLKAQAARRLPTDTHPPLSLSLSTSHGLQLSHTHALSQTTEYTRVDSGLEEGLGEIDDERERERVEEREREREEEGVAYIMDDSVVEVYENEPEEDTIMREREREREREKHDMKSSEEIEEQREREREIEMRKQERNVDENLT
eukprot:CAMPEP_0182417516 /NCGR_PEP_ID=MMETSP1167-20130531/1985_1 /TAXON_ID=2988 /ORGANISM="Mallomonas Sp, Strain CCMP3275" /LENGTH=249 /DNA_ID=CAMNT_0024591151 /DNA_START=876 /DNA_END=1621 /DNA_ORIENTATION=-